MPHTKLLLWLVLGTFWLVGCGTTPELAFEPEPNTEIQLTEVVAQLPTVAPTAVLPTATPSLMPTNTAVSTTSTMTVTPIPTLTATPTRTPTPTVIPPPTAVALNPSIRPPTGELYFSWDSKTLPAHDPTPYDPAPKLYRAYVQEENGAFAWYITPVISQLFDWPRLAFSPDKSQIAVRILEDRNNDGEISDEIYYDRLSDDYNLFTYTLSNQSLERITENYPSFISWVGNDYVLVRESTSYSLVSVTDHSENQLLSDTPITDILSISTSPNGQWLAINLRSGEIKIIEVETNEVDHVLQTTGGEDTLLVWSPNSSYLSISHPSGALHVFNISSSQLRFLSNTNGSHFVDWAPNSQWLAINKGDQIEIFDVLSQESIVTHEKTVETLAWSPDSQHVAFVEKIDDNYKLFVLDISNLSLHFFVETPKIIHHLAWSPDSEMLAMSAFAYDRNRTKTLGVVNISSQSYQEIWIDSDSRRHLLGWSPDSQWLLIIEEEWEKIGYNYRTTISLLSLHRNNVDFLTILSASNTAMPSEFYWLPTASGNN